MGSWQFSHPKVCINIACYFLAWTSDAFKLRVVQCMASLLSLALIVGYQNLLCLPGPPSSAQPRVSRQCRVAKSPYRKSPCSARPLSVRAVRSSSLCLALTVLFVPNPVVSPAVPNCRVFLQCWPLGSLSALEMLSPCVQAKSP